VTQNLKIILLGSAIMAARGTVAAEEETHATSARISEEISAGLPKFLQKKVDAAASEKPANPAAKQAAPDPTISVLPTVTVRETRLPSADRVLTYEGKAEKVVAAYMGDSDGLDRGVLNRYTLKQLWQKIPFLGALPFVGTPFRMTNAERAYDRSGANDKLGRPVPSPNEPPD
jgi:hypothetical protein